MRIITRNSPGKKGASTNTVVSSPTRLSHLSKSSSPHKEVSNSRKTPAQPTSTQSSLSITQSLAIGLALAKVARNSLQNMPMC